MGTGCLGSFNGRSKRQLVDWDLIWGVLDKLSIADRQRTIKLAGANALKIENWRAAPMPLKAQERPPPTTGWLFMTRYWAFTNIYNHTSHRL